MAKGIHNRPRRATIAVPLAVVEAPTMAESSRPRGIDP